MSNPYVVADSIIKELRYRCEKELKKLYPQGIPSEILKRIEREEAALMSSSNTYGLVIVDEVIKTLRDHKFDATLGGDWLSGCIAWLLDLHGLNPIDDRILLREMGFDTKQFIRDNCVSSPIEITVSPQYGKTLCRELIEMVARKYYFWVSECPNQKDTFRLIAECYRDDDIYAKYAPIIKIVK